ncbi:cell division protein FtsQ/DivIB [Hyphococcus sp.]|uniref:cell division protein FtsQ/DivIB n=1 Tax=Hyphococcus sp. TaxID=2038636 RepID=UPI003D13045B
MKKKTPAKSRRKSRKKPSGFFDRLSAVWTSMSRAAVAGSVLVAFVALGFLWAGGYIGLLGEKLNRVAGAGAVSAGFEITRITARGFSKTEEDDLLSAVGPIVGSSILHFDADRARARVEELGWVRSAAVSRLLPNTVHVSVRERQPAAVWQLSGNLHLIDNQGAVIREVSAYEYSDLPLIVGAGAPDAASEMLQVLERASAIQQRTSALIRVSDRRWNLKTKDGVEVRFPEKNLADAMDYLSRIEAKTGLLDEPLEYVDLRNADNFVYRKRGAVELDMPLGQVN